MIVVHGLRDET